MSLLTDIADGVATLTLDRPEVHNAFDDALIARLTEAFRQAGADPAVRAVVLRGNGKSFSAGADLAWMKRMAGYGEAENLADARALAALLQAIDTCPKPTIARVHGAAFGGATGLIACCDIAVAVPEALFGMTEVRLGLVPAVISPYLVRAMGPRRARRYFLTAERFPATEALRIGLVHEIVPAERLDEAIAAHLAALRQAGPQALAAAKQLVTDVDRPIDDAVIDGTARLIARIRASEEGREGLSAFLEKRKPGWAQ